MKKMLLRILAICFLLSMFVFGISFTLLPVLALLDFVEAITVDWYRYFVVLGVSGGMMVFLPFLFGGYKHEVV